MIYADYSYYTQQYHGTQPEGAYHRLSRQASAYLDTLTMGRISGSLWATDSRVQDACCSVVEELAFQEAGGEVTTANNDGYMESYATSGKSHAARLYDAAALYLANTGLLYRGS